MAQIHDETSALTPEARQRLLDAMTRAEAADGVEHLVRIVAAVAGKAWRAQAVADRARLSTRPESSLLTLVAIDDRHVEVATAPRFNHLLTRSATTALLQAVFVPRMRAGDLVGALLATVEALGQALRSEPARRSGWRRWVWPVFILAMVGAAGWMIVTDYVRDHRCPRCQAMGEVEHRVLIHATTTTTGQGEREFTCRGCGFHQIQAEVLPVDTPSSSSDSDSGGGSTDGGGGADW